MFDGQEKTRSRWLVLLMGLIITGLLFTRALAAIPDDISGHWAQSQLEEWMEAGWLSDYEDGTVRPDRQVTRAECIVFVGRAYALPQLAADCEFTDVDEEDWYHDHVCAGVEAGLLKGRPDGTFGSDEPITRTESVTVPNRGLSYPQTYDAEIEQWIDYSRDVFLAQAREYQDRLYLLATYGEKPTGGYQVEIAGVEQQADELVVEVHFTDPDEDEEVYNPYTSEIHVRDTQ